ncbi:uncharacterized protein LOC126823950 [Patella vulgata]|uniref:uncharacterized protein LOC126823950 n=1 Tax=Patella vulgata TaxID=6465 RepID=UPI00217FF859|nr:uncharacterized protein LOC126823950 [Patella vulgata]
MQLLVIFAVIACALAAPCVHDNHADLTEEHVMNMVVAAADSNSDGVISEIDIISYFIVNFDHNGNLAIEESEFVKQWNQDFHDEVAFAQHVFHHLDTDDNGRLDISDVDPLVKRADTNGDGVIQTTEFKAYLEAIYNAC